MTIQTLDATNPRPTGQIEELASLTKIGDDALTIVAARHLTLLPNRETPNSSLSEIRGGMLSVSKSCRQSVVVAGYTQLNEFSFWLAGQLDKEELTEEERQLLGNTIDADRSGGLVSLHAQSMNYRSLILNLLRRLPKARLSILEQNSKMETLPLYLFDIFRIANIFQSIDSGVALNVDFSADIERLCALREYDLAEEQGNRIGNNELRERVLDKVVVSKIDQLLKGGRIKEAISLSKQLVGHYTKSRVLRNVSIALRSPLSPVDESLFDLIGVVGEQVTFFLSSEFAGRSIAPHMKFLQDFVMTLALLDWTIEPQDQKQALVELLDSILEQLDPDKDFPISKGMNSVMVMSLLRHATFLKNAAMVFAKLGVVDASMRHESKAFALIHQLASIRGLTIKKVIRRDPLIDRIYLLQVRDALPLAEDGKYTVIKGLIDSLAPPRNKRRQLF